MTTPDMDLIEKVATEMNNVTYGASAWCSAKRLRRAQARAALKVMLREMEVFAPQSSLKIYVHRFAKAHGITLEDTP